MIRNCEAIMGTYHSTGDYVAWPNMNDVNYALWGHIILIGVN